MTAPLDGLTALVTGAGASIGLATAELLARDGASVVLTGLDESQLVDAARRVRAGAAPGAVVAHAVADSCDEASIAAAVGRATELAGRFAICVSAVGHTTMAPILRYTPDEWWHDLDLNVFGTFLTLKHAGRAMRECGGGAFVAVSSHAGIRSMRSLGSYCSAKAALDAFVRVAADELGAHGIRVNAVRPGLTQREQASPIFGHDDIEQEYLVRTPLGRNGVPRDSANVIRFLAGPESSWMTGQCLTVDGGMAIRGAPDLEPAARRVRGDALFAAEPHTTVGSPPSSATRLAGARALVTGGASSIGLGATRVLARDGAQVLMVGRNETKLRDVTARLRDEGLEVDWTTADVTDEAQIERAVAKAASDTGRLDICVASAGGATMSPLLDYELANFHEPFRLNVVGSYLTLKHACRAMPAGGSFIAISSESAIISIRNLSAYCASKAALDMMVRVAADELGGRGVRVNAIRPGLTRREAPSPIFSNDDVMRRYREQTPLVRSGLPDDCAYAVRYFAGRESSWTTGQCLTINGGMNLRGAPDLSSALSRFRELTETQP